MKQMENARKQYDAIPIPDELYIRVQKTIEEMDPAHKSPNKVVNMDASPIKRGNQISCTEGKPALIKGVKRGIWAAAAAMAIFVTALNTNTVFAQEVGKIPVLGAVARVLTFRSYVEENEDMSISVEMPSVEMIAQDNSGLAASINETIYQFCEQYAQEARQIAEDYKEAFMATGGTQEEWEAHNIQIRVWYEIKSQTEDYLSFIVTGTQNWSSAYTEKRFYNIDLKSEKLITLQDVLGEDYRSKADASIKEQMAQMEAQGTVQFFTPEEGGFTGIDENERFYMNAAGNPVIVFEKYQIAPGAAGEIEFEIKK